MKHLRAEKIDFCAVRDRGNKEEQHGLARRVFAVLQPLFAHLADKQYTHYLEAVVLDAEAVVFRGNFIVDEAGRDQGLIAVRIAEMPYRGQTIAHLTAHIGLHPDARGERHSTYLNFTEALRYRLRHPLCPFYIIDTPVSAASYRKMLKGLAEVYPTPDKAVPAELWPVCEAVAAQRDWQPIPGCPKEARLINRPLTDLSHTDLRNKSEEFSSLERWFSETTQRTPGSGILLISPVSYSNFFLSSLKVVRASFDKKAAATASHI